RRHAGVDAAGTQEFQLFAAVFPGGMDHVHLQRHVVVHEIRQCFLIGYDAAHLGRSQKDVFRLFSGKEGFHRLLTAEIQFPVGAGDQVGVPLALQFPHNGAAHHAAVPGYIDLRVFLHHSFRLLSLNKQTVAKRGRRGPYLMTPFSRYSARLVLMCSSARSTATFFISWSTMIRTSSSKLVLVGFQPSFRLALEGSPRRLTT